MTQGHITVTFKKKAIQKYRLDEAFISGRSREATGPFNPLPLPTQPLTT
jgi:hypothetical protein